jgi:hypothetical protein
MVLSASLPTLGAGALKDRDDPKVFGTAKVNCALLFESYCLLNLLIKNRNPTFFSLLRPSTRLLPSIAPEVKSL